MCIFRSVFRFSGLLILLLLIVIIVIVFCVVVVCCAKIAWFVQKLRGLCPLCHTAKIGKRTASAHAQTPATTPKTATPTKSPEVTFKPDIASGYSKIARKICTSEIQVKHARQNESKQGHTHAKRTRRQAPGHPYPPGIREPLQTITDTSPHKITTKNTSNG